MKVEDSWGQPGPQRLATLGMRAPHGRPAPSFHSHCLPCRLRVRHPERRRARDLALIAWTLAPGTSLPVAGTPSLRSQSGPRGHRQQWRRRHGRLRGGLCSALQRDLWLRHFFSRVGLCDSRRRRTFQASAEKPGLKPPRLGFTATSPLRHCACAPGERCALAEPIGTRVLAFTSRGPGPVSMATSSTHPPTCLLACKVLKGILKFV